MSKGKARIGDIAEIKTAAGLAYVQYTHDNVDMGQLVRVLPGLFDARPPDFRELARQKELYFVFYTLNHALSNRQAEVVSHQPVPEWANPYPLMRHGGFSKNRDTQTWKVLDASTSLTVDALSRMRKLHDLTAEQKRLSIYLLRPHPVMLRDLARGWTPERAEELDLQDAAAGEVKRADSLTMGEPSNHRMRHYLYFPEKSNAEKAGQWFRSQGLSVEVRRGADGENWLALVTQAPPKSDEECEKLREEMEALAEELDGEYDGWELAV
jgi:hypothetical protein